MNKDDPYLITKRIVIDRAYNPEYGDERVCECGHPYYRHFDSYEDNRPCGCKYCMCYEFVESKFPEVSPILAKKANAGYALNSALDDPKCHHLIPVYQDRVDVLERELLGLCGKAHEGSRLLYPTEEELREMEARVKKFHFLNTAPDSSDEEY